MNAVILAKKGCHSDSIVCLDINKKKLYVPGKQDSFAHYIVCDARLLPFKEGGFYDVVCTDVLGHIINCEVVLKEILRLKPKFIYLRFPTEAREKLLTSSQEYTGPVEKRLMSLTEQLNLSARIVLIGIFKRVYKVIQNILKYKTRL